MRTARWWIWAAAAALVLGMVPAALGAGEEGEVPNGEGRVVLGWETFKRVTGWRGDEEEAAEAGVFTLGWEDVRGLLGIDAIEGVGASELAKVRLPWKEFRALLEWSVTQKKDTTPPPTDWVISSAVYHGLLSKDGAVFEAEFGVSVLKEKGWVSVPLLPASVAVQEAELPAGAYLSLSGGHYQMMVASTGRKDATVRVKFSTAVTEQAGSNTTRFDRVSSGTSVVKLELEQTGVDIKVAGAQSTTKQDDGKVTTVVAALPSGAPVQVSWERAIPEAEKVPPKLYAETQTLVAVGDGILVGRERVDFNILHTGVRVLKLGIPADVSILEVQGNRVRDWRVAGQELVVALSFEALGGYTLNVTYERPFQVEEAAELVLPILRASDVVRERGDIGVVAMANVELTSPRLAGATAIDVRELPPELLGMTSQPILLAYRFVTDAFEIAMSVKKHEDVSVLVTIVDSAVLTTMQTLDGRRITKAIYNVRNNRQQFLRLAMPEGVEIWSASVSGRSIRPARDEQGRILVPLVRSQGASSGLAAFPVELVYVEKGEQPPESGTLEIQLPRASEPITHVMVNLYLPKEGKYTRAWSDEPDVSGPLTPVKQFRRLVSAVGEAGVPSEKMAEALQQAAQSQADAAAASAGATPIRVNLPLDGTLLRLEKILVLDEPLFIGVKYSGWKR